MFGGAFESLETELRRRAARATVSAFRLSNPWLRERLHQLFHNPPGREGSFLGQPVFEALFEYQRSSKTLSESGLHPRTVAALESPPPGHEKRAFSSDQRPYSHQQEAWDKLRLVPARSVIVSAGTASGKTECFLIPILDDLITQWVNGGKQPLVGVQALFLYPLNALINSQRERLAAWTAGLKGGVRFCLYNGATPEEGTPQKKIDAFPEQVHDRRQLRNDPPPILVTNATMLEYMLLRPADRPILNKSQGKLRWIVLDEAHTYLGSNAAEISMLLRRVTLEFGVHPRDIRYIATSATMGGNEAAERDLRGYLADLAGVPIEQVDFITGRRVAPALEDSPQDLSWPTCDELTSLSDYRARRRRLEAVPIVRELRGRLTMAPATLDELGKALGSDTTEGALRRLDVLSESPPPNTQMPDGSKTQPLLALRGHFFLRSQPGVWACWNPTCSGRGTATEFDASWPFGAIYLSRRTKCLHCDSLVFEVFSCDTCGAVYLEGWEDTDQALHPSNRPRSVTPEATQYDDDPEQDSPTDDPAPVPAGTEEDEDWTQLPLVQEPGRRRLLFAGRGDQIPQADVDDQEGPIESACDLRTGELSDGDGTVSLIVAGDDADGSQPRCVICRGADRRSRRNFRALRLGADFFIQIGLPALLEHAPSNGGPELPWEGRQALSFSDSRQGTARSALAAQLTSERNWFRSYVFHEIGQNVCPAEPEQINEAKVRVEELRKLNSPALRQVLQQQEERLRQLEAGPVPAAQTWNELRKKLAATDEVRGMAERAIDQAQLSDPAQHYADRLLFREFFRRPRTANSLETMGLASLRYPALEEVASPPNGWPGDIAEWKAFLKLTLDFFVRANSAVLIERDVLRWLGTKIRTKTLMPPDTDRSAVTRSQLIWPRVGPAGRLPRLARLLEIAFLPTGATLNRADLNSFLRAAWEALVRVPGGVLMNSQDGHFLDLSKQMVCVSFEAWKCPVTHRMLDTTLRARSIYQSDRPDGASLAANRVAFPQFAHPFGRNRNGTPVPIAERRATTESAADVLAMRKEGDWTEFHDRIYEYARWFVVGEHSGQQKKSRLESLEKDFNARTVNVLGCSTTMEMGIDIGGLSAVAMNNAPPGPANWLQRAGRAGRRDIAQAFSTTLCTAQPHGEAVFASTMWPFLTPIHVPRVSLESARIVGRHVNAWLLGRFLKQAVQTMNRIFLRCEGFFLPVEGREVSLVDEFLQSLDEPTIIEAAEEGLSVLTAYSSLAEESPTKLVAAARDFLFDVHDKWNCRRAVLADQVAVFSESDKSPEKKAVARQLRRFEREFLLKELSNAGFLPSHGFPIGVLPFVTTTAEDLRTEEFRRRSADGTDEDTDSGDESQFVRQQYPSRDLAMAIREYAPGNPVVIDGRVLVSKGITMHWQLPPGDGAVNETQAICWAWRCRACGNADSGHVVPPNCLNCHSGDLDRHLYLEPTGFSVDIRDLATNHLDSRVYIPPRDPWIAGSGDWTPLANPKMGRIRHAAEGLVYHYSDGKNGFGYAVCLQCGRAGSELSDDPQQEPPFSSPHNRLRTGRKSSPSERPAVDTAYCPGNDRIGAIKRNLWLGGIKATDVFEARLAASPGKPWTIGAVQAVAVAMRTALARRLGIDNRELGWAASVRNNEAHIQLFDTAAGGAGYSAAGLIDFAQLLASARQLIACPKNCDRACHACLLDFDTQHAAESFDRQTALEILEDAYFARLSLPEALQVFGPSTVAESRSAPASLSQQARRLGLREVRLYTRGRPGDWRLDEWKPWSILARARADSTNARFILVTPQSDFDSLDWAAQHTWASRLAALSVEWILTGNDLLVGSARLLMEIQTADAVSKWATTEPEPLLPNEEWGHARNTPLLQVGGAGTLEQVDGTVVSLEQILARRPGGVVDAAIRKELDGNIVGVGKQFWSHLTKRAVALAAKLQDGPPRKITYHDRYLRTPLFVRVLREVLARFAVAGSKGTALDIYTSFQPPTSRGGPTELQHNWSVEQDQRNVILGVFEDQFVTAVHLQPKSSLPHARELCLEWPGGSSIKIRLDEGFGFLEAQFPQPTHDFRDGAAKQVQQIVNKRFSVRKRQGTNESPIYLHFT